MPYVIKKYVFAVLNNGIKMPNDTFNKRSTDVNFFLIKLMELSELSNPK